MKAYTLGESGAALREMDPPEPGPTQLLVRMEAAGLNRIDVLTLQAAARGLGTGHVATLGRELAGTVEAVGEQVSRFQPGDLVMGMAPGALAEYALMEEALAIAIPPGVSMELAGGLPLALNTMHDAVVTWGRLQSGQSVLVQGASSGVGMMALQIARELGAELVIGSSRSAVRRERLAEFGAQLTVDTGEPGWVEQVLDATGGHGVDLIIDQIGSPVANRNMLATRLEGRIVNVGRLGGNTGEFDFDLHALRRITYVGVTFRTRTPQEVAAITARAAEELGPGIAAGRIWLPVDSTFPLERAGDALEYMAQDQHFGKIIINGA